MYPQNPAKIKVHKNLLPYLNLVWKERRAKVSENESWKTRKMKEEHYKHAVVPEEIRSQGESVFSCMEKMQEIQMRQIQL